MKPLRQYLHAKIHSARVTEADLDYVGSITIDEALLERTGMHPGELVHVWNVTNGNRFETYVLSGPAESRVICVNGAAAHLVDVGDKLIIASFCLSPEPVVPTVIIVDDNNRFLSRVEDPLRATTVTEPPTARSPKTPGDASA